MIVVGDEGLDPGCEIARQEVVLQQDAVLQGLVPAFNLALCLRVIWRSTHMTHPVITELFGQVSGDVRRTIIGQQSRPMQTLA